MVSLKENFSEYISKPPVLYDFDDKKRLDKINVRERIREDLEKIGFNCFYFLGWSMASIF